jgi:hypothetical protein
MYLIKHIKNNNYFKNKITQDVWHYVYSEKDAHQFKNKYEAKKTLNKFNHPEHFEIICIK